MTVALASILLLSAFAMAAAVYDWTRRRIPNWLSLTVAVSGLAFAGLSGDRGDLGSHVLHLVAALLAGMLLFRMGAFGGGDAKLYAGVAAWFPIRAAPALLVDVSMTGLVLFLCWIAARRAMGVPFRIRDPGTFDKFPYGVAIGVGAVMTLWWQTFQ